MKKHYLSDAYISLLKDETSAYIFNGSDGLYSLGDYLSWVGERPISIVPGSFNPVHDAHRAMYKQGSNSFFELSISRVNKSELALHELVSRVGQFMERKERVIITNAPRMIHKIGIIKKSLPNFELFFSIGVDTYVRMLDDYQDIGISALNATFLVYDRNLHGNEICSLKDFGRFTPKNCLRMQHQDKNLCYLSSTKIREGSE